MYAQTILLIKRIHYKTFINITKTIYSQGAQQKCVDDIIFHKLVEQSQLINWYNEQSKSEN